jgi:hypothetical protein
MSLRLRTNQVNKESVGGPVLSIIDFVLRRIMAGGVCRWQRSADILSASWCGPLSLSPEYFFS